MSLSIYNIRGESVRVLYMVFALSAAASLLFRDSLSFRRSLVFVFFRLFDGAVWRWWCGRARLPNFRSLSLFNELVRCLLPLQPARPPAQRRSVTDGRRLALTNALWHRDGNAIHLFLFVSSSSSSSISFPFSSTEKTTTMAVAFYSTRKRERESKTHADDQVKDTNGRWSLITTPHKMMSSTGLNVLRLYRHSNAGFSSAK